MNDHLKDYTEVDFLLPAGSRLLLLQDQQCQPSETPLKAESSDTEDMLVAADHDAVMQENVIAPQGVTKPSRQMNHASDTRTILLLAIYIHYILYLLCKTYF